jgi:hypothetical protein
MRIGGQELAEVRIRRQESEDKLDRNTCSPNNWLSDHHVRVDGDAIQERSILWHHSLRCHRVFHIGRAESGVDQIESRVVLKPAWPC